jgi:hypothetical protein
MRALTSRAECVIGNRHITSYSVQRADAPWSTAELRPHQTAGGEIPPQPSPVNHSAQSPAPPPAPPPVWRPCSPTAIRSRRPETCCGPDRGKSAATHPAAHTTPGHPSASGVPAAGASRQSYHCRYRAAHDVRRVVRTPRYRRWPRDAACRQSPHTP